MQANMGMSGEFRCVVKRADGSTKIDTGYQKNLILNQGLDFFGGSNGSDMMAYCVIGSSQANFAIRSALFYTKMAFWQIRFGSVADDSPITKTNTQTLSIPIEFSWGRYEGAL